MNSSDFYASSLPRADVYTDLNSLERIKYDEDKDAAIKKVAQQFEALFLQMMLKGMRKSNAVFEEGNLLNSSESQYFRDLHDQQLSLSLSHGKGIGIADVLYRQLTSNKSNQNTAVETNFRLDNVATIAHTTKQSESKAIDQSSKAASEATPVSQRKAIASSPEAFIKLVSPLAQQAAQKIGVDKNLLIAQTALETGWGKFVLANENGLSSNNLFNIKSNSNWQGKELLVQSLEFENSTFQPKLSSFRSYETIAESFEDYANFILTHDRYKNARDQAKSPEGYIKELHAAGYATDPHYSDKVLEVYKRVSLQNTELAKGAQGIPRS